MQLSQVRAVLFDLDGTLMNTLPGITALVNQVREDFEREPLSMEEVGGYIGKGMLILMHRVMTRSLDGRLDNQIYQMAVRSLQKHIDAGRYDKGTPYPGVPEALRALRDNGYKVAVVTNKHYDMTLTVLKEKGLLDMFDVIVGGDSASAPKPSPAPILLAMEKLGVSAEQCVMVGDSGNDSSSAKEAGVSCFLVRGGWTEGLLIEDICVRDNAEGVFKDVPEVVDHLIASKQ